MGTSKCTQPVFYVFKYFSKLLLPVMFYFQSFSIFVKLFFKTTPSPPPKQKKWKKIKRCGQKIPCFQNKFSKDCFLSKKYQMCFQV